MAQTDRQTDKAEKASPASLIPPEFTEMRKKRFEELVAIQSEQLEKLQEVNRHWMNRMQSEAKLASEFTAKLTAARSMPEVATQDREAYHTLQRLLP